MATARRTTDRPAPAPAKRAKADPVPRQEPVSAFAVAAKIISTSAAAREAEPVLVPIPGLALYGAAVAVEKLLKSTKALLKVPVSAAAVDVWVSEANRERARPRNFRGVELCEDGTIDMAKQASVELRKRATNEPLDDDEVALLHADGVEYAEVPLVKGSSTFAINPRYEHDAVLLERVGKAIASVPGVPDDFIVQPVKRVVDNETLTQVFVARVSETPQQYEDRVRRLISVVTRVGVKPTTNDDPIQQLELLLLALRDEKLPTNSEEED